MSHKEPVSLKGVDESYYEKCTTGNGVICLSVKAMSVQ